MVCDVQRLAIAIYTNSLDNYSLQK